MIKPKISIIIPVYNGEKYVLKCLKSIVAQTFTDWECIVVNDGSKDNTKYVLDDFLCNSECSRKFIIIHKENEGVSVARNTGLNVAKGEWVAFSDADDYYYPDAFQQLLDAARTTNAKVVLGNAHRLYMDGRKIQRYPHFTVVEKRNYFPKGSIEMWGDLFHHSIFQSEDFRFVPGLAYLEDRCLMLKILSSVGEYAVSPNPLYCQYRNPDSVMRSPDGLRMAKHCFWAASLMAEYRTVAPIFKDEIDADSQNAVVRGCTYFYNSKNATYKELEKTYLEYFSDQTYLRRVYINIILTQYKRKFKSFVKRILGR